LLSLLCCLSAAAPSLSSDFAIVAFWPSQDIIDEMLPITFFDFAQAFFMVFGALVRVSVFGVHFM